MEIKKFICLVIISQSILITLSSCKQEREECSNKVEINADFILAVQKYDVLGEFSEGLAPVGKTEDDGTTLWGYINTKGEEVIPCNIEALKVGCFSEGLACILKDGKFSFINHNGESVIKLDMPGAYCSEEEISFLRITKNDPPCFKNGECALQYIDDVHKVVYINKEGIVLREEVYEFKENSSNSINSKYELFSEEGGYNNVGLKDKKGNIIIPAIYDEIIIGDDDCGVFLATIADVWEDGMMPDWHVGYVDLKGHDTFPEVIKKAIRRREYAKESMMTDFSQKMNEAKWINTNEKFRYPSFFAESEHFFEDEPCTCHMYAYGDVSLCRLDLGNWATFDEEYPLPGHNLAPNVKISNITYEASRAPIYSGYTSDGRIFYLKRLTSTLNVDVPHAHVLALIYPEDYQPYVQELIDIVKVWNYYR